MGLADYLLRFKNNNGHNTLLTLEELVELQLKIVVIGKNPTEPGIFNFSASYGDSDIVSYTELRKNCLLVDSEWVSSQVLGEKGSDDEFKDAYLLTKRLYEIGERRSYEQYEALDKSAESSAGFNEYFLEGKKSKKQMEAARAKYMLYRPTVLTELINRADIIVSPPEHISKLEAEFPNANIALLVPGNSFFHLNEPAEEYRHLRVLLREKHEDERRIDYKTISMLMNPEGQRGTSFPSFLSQSRLSRLEGALAEFFYQTLNQDYSSPVKRTPITVQENGRKLVLENSISNFYGLGGHKRNSMTRGQKLLKAMREAKQERIRMLYDSLWIIPLDSIEEILEKHKLLDELEAPENFEKIKALARGINGIIEPYTNLSSMADLLSANILHSRFGARISKEEFYRDFMAVSLQFLKAYQLAASNLETGSSSRELVFSENLLNYVFSDDGMGRTYDFIGRVVRQKPGDFYALRGIFESELKATKAAKIRELEDYKPPEKVEEETGQDDSLTLLNSFNAALEEMAGDIGLLPGKEPNRIEELQNPKVLKEPFPDYEIANTKVSNGWDQDTLERLLNKFHSQNPVTRSKSTLPILDYVGTKLAAYLALASFFKKNKWVKPEIIDGEDGIIDIKQGYYPLLQSRFVVPNDTYLDSDFKVEILEGTNNGGKTVDLKKTMFIVIASMMGNYVPAESARISFFERARYRIKETGMYDTGALDADLQNIGTSLRAIGRPLLIGFDETFTSTNAREGEALTYGLIRRVMESGNARAVITSHYPTLHDLDGIPGIYFSHFDYERNSSSLNFPHKKIIGINIAGDYALIIAENNRLPGRVLHHAQEYYQRVRGKNGSS